MEKINEKKDKNDVAYPLYAAKDDIYSQSKDEVNIDPEDVGAKKSANENYKSGSKEQPNFSEEASSDNLDVPGSELDDEQENTGSEDEENNFYSLGGDAHSNLDEDNGG